MVVLRTTADLSAYLKNKDCKPGCFADTSFLYGIAYDDDRLHEKANAVLDQLSENSVPIYANVISRMEFVDLILRKQMTSACISLFGQLHRTSSNETLFNLLKNIRDKDTAARGTESYKINESHFKKLRKLIVEATADTDWKSFCGKYVGTTLLPEWQFLEEELGLNFIEILEGSTSEFFNETLLWNDMVQIMGKNGMRGPDAMILNLFLKSKFPLLISGDSDFETYFKDSVGSTTDKAILIL
jgi:predicted nucleic acid-binding protein